jgi:hypothetical protein
MLRVVLAAPRRALRATLAIEAHAHLLLLTDIDIDTRIDDRQYGFHEAY